MELSLDLLVRWYNFPEPEAFTFSRLDLETKVESVNSGIGQAAVVIKILRRNFAMNARDFYGSKCGTIAIFPRNSLTF